jgi:hypothetical protein
VTDPQRTCLTCNGTGFLPPQEVVTTKKRARKLSRRQDETRPYAERHGTDWTSAELELLETSTLSQRDLALQLGRSYSAVHTMKYNLTSGRGARRRETT